MVLGKGRTNHHGQGDLCDQPASAPHAGDDQNEGDSEYLNILRALFTRGSAQVWAGSFNSLCEEDYGEEEWGRVRRRRRENNWEIPRTEVRRLLWVVFMQ